MLRDARFFYCISIPLWEGFDEHAHFAYVQHLATRGEWLVDSATTASREVEQSMALVPMPWTIRAESPLYATHESYWQLPAAERFERERELRALPRTLGALGSVRSMPIESQQPPLSYWLMALVYFVLDDLDLAARVLGLRIVNLLLASVAAPAAWMAMRAFTGRHGHREAVAAAALVAVMPEVLFDAARVANSGLSIALFSMLAVMCVRIVEGKRTAALWAGVTLGAGMLTKAFFLTAVPALAAVLI